MDDIAKHAGKLVLPYVRSHMAEEIIASAKQLASIVLADAALLPGHKRGALSLVQWLISEADGKYTTRYRSRQVVDLARHTPASTEKINHEHVSTRRSITQQLLAEPHRASEILDQVIGCVVTKFEHQKIKTASSDWNRYKLAGIEVLDMAEIPPRLHDLG